MIDTDTRPPAGEVARDERWLGPAILRVAGWPIESLDGLRSRQLTQRIDDWIGAEAEIRRESDALAIRIHEIIPCLADKTIRRQALALKRSLHGSLSPWPKGLTEGLLDHEAIRPALGPAILAAAARRTSHAAERSAIERAHAAELERASAVLETVVSEASFQRALCLASPSVFHQWQHARSGSSSRRSRTRLQGTLHRYLMRAIGRATPNGLWAGVALEDVTQATSVPLQTEAATPVIRVSPALAIFSRGLEQLNRRRPWIEQVAWRRNPTLRQRDDGQWEFGTFAEGSWSLRGIAHHAQLDALCEDVALADRPSLRDVEVLLCRRFPALPASDARRLCEIWIEGGILWSTACLPAFFTDTWQALDAVIETLPPSEQPLWRDCRARLRRIADEIEDGIETIEAGVLRALLDDARLAVGDVLGRYEAAMPDADVLVIDRTAPFRFAMSRDLVELIEATLRRYWAFDRYGLGEIETRIAIAHFFGEMSRGAQIPLADFLSRGAETDPAQRAWSWQDRVLPRASPASAELAREAFARWERELEPVVDRRVHRLATDNARATAPLPPGSAMLLLGRSAVGLHLRVGGLTPEPSFFYSRFSHLFGEGDAFRIWQRTKIGAAGQRWPGLRFLDLAIRNHFNPNVTARPRAAAGFIDPLDAESGLLREGRIARNRNGRPILSASAGSRPAELLIPSARSAAYLGGLDRFASVLASMSFFLGRPPLLAPIPRLTREIENWHHLPRLIVDDAVVSPERWTPEASFGTTLANARGAERLIQWRRFVRAAGLPDMVYTFQGRHQTESLLATDSAIAVELLGQELQANGPAIRMQELFPAPDDFAVRDAGGNRYVAELAVPWFADAAFWQDYVEGAALDELETPAAPPP